MCAVAVVIFFFFFEVITFTTRAEIILRTHITLFHNKFRLRNVIGPEAFFPPVCAAVKQGLNRDAERALQVSLIAVNYTN